MKEQEKLAIIIRYADGIITGAEAAKQLGLTVRQVQRKKKAYLTEGIASIIHKTKGKPTGSGFGLLVREVRRARFILAPRR